MEQGISWCIHKLEVQIDVIAATPLNPQKSGRISSF
jgi:hypothetical protein